MENFIFCAVLPENKQELEDQLDAILHLTN